MTSRPPVDNPDAAMWRTIKCIVMYYKIHSVNVSVFHDYCNLALQEICNHPNGYVGIISWQLGVRE